MRARSIHLLQRREGAPAPMTCCGAKLSAKDVMRGRTAHVPEKAACYACAKEAEGLTEEQRQHVWDNRSDQIAKDRKSPWQVAREKQEKAEAKAARVKAAEERRAEAEAKKKARDAARTQPF